MATRQQGQQQQHRRNANLTDTTHRDVFPFSRPNNNNVVYAFNTDASRPGLTRITLSAGSTWTPSPHWHESYTEYLRVIQGRVKVILDGKTRIVTSSDGPLVVERYVVHEWMRADLDSDSKDDGDVVVEEWTDPADGIKQVFFRNLLGTLEDAGRYWQGWTALQIWLICSAYDNYEVLVPQWVPWWISYVVTHAVFVVVRSASWAMGLRAWYEMYTPSELRNAAAAAAATTRHS